ncbi:MAG: sodium:solute symporter [Phycisphaerales bacterium]
MNMHFIDWSIVAIFAIGLFAAAIYTKQYTRSVADFLAANRCAGRYLICISQGVTGTGAISFIAMFTMYYESGFTAYWWTIALWPIGLLMMLCGWIIYRYRETRVMTLAQLFEVRYSKKFRIFCGILAWVSGVINMGIFPAVTARFFIFFCGLPQNVHILGFNVSTFVLIMTIELSIALLLTFLGGMVVVAITDLLQGIFCNIAYLIIIAVLYFSFDWSQILTSLKTAPLDASMLNPFKTTQAVSFNLKFFMMNIFIYIYTVRTWQGAQGYNCAAKNAHEAKMAGIIGTWRGLIQNTLILMLPICAFVFLHNTDFAAKAFPAQQAISSLPAGEIKDQMIVPLALTKILPVGIIGLFAAVMLAAAIGTDDTYLHSWGSIFVQDVILPFRKKALDPKQHILLLRLSILLVAVFIFLFSLFFKENDHIFMYLTLTGSIYTGGAGSVLLGGLYWKRGSTAAAWCAMIIGGGLSFLGLTIQTAWPSLTPVLLEWFPNSQFINSNFNKFPYDGMVISFYAVLSAILAYIGVSMWNWLVLKRPAFNMDRMLHRGQYAIKGEHIKGETAPVTGWRSILPSKEFTGADKMLHVSLTLWTLGWFIFFVAVTVYHLLIGTTDDWWGKFWWFFVVITVVLGTITTIWFSIGGIKDLNYMFKALRSAVIDTEDDGRVREADSKAKTDSGEKTVLKA